MILPLVFHSRQSVAKIFPVFRVSLHIQDLFKNRREVLQASDHGPCLIITTGNIYEAMVFVAYNSENQVVRDAGIKTGTSTSGKRIMSYDNGKTWQIDPTEKDSVYVSWKKIEK